LVAKLGELVGAIEKDGVEFGKEREPVQVAKVVDVQAVEVRESVEEVEVQGGEGVQQAA